MGNQGICRIRAFPTSRSLGSREIRGGPPDPSTSPEPAGQQRPTSYLAENTAGRACSRIAGMPRDSHPHSQSLFLNTSDTMSWYLPQAPGSAGLDTEAAPAWGWLGDTLRALAVGAQLILRVEQGLDPEGWCRAGGQVIETARASLNVKQRHPRPRSGGAALLGGRAEQGQAPSLGSREEWDAGLEKQQRQRFGPPPSPPASAPNTIIHRAPHTTVSTGSRPLTSDERSRPCTARRPLQPARSRSHAHTIPLVQAHVDRSTHAHSHKCPSRLLTAMTHVSLCSDARVHVRFVRSLMAAPLAHTQCIHGHTCPAKRVVLETAIHRQIRK